MERSVEPDLYMETVKQLEDENRRLKEGLQDMIEYGLRFDLNPTHELPRGESAIWQDQWWTTYFEMADRSLRTRAKSVLTGYWAGETVLATTFSGI